MTKSAYSLLVLAWISFAFTANAIAYQITAQDEKSLTFASGEIKEDPNRYQVIYDVNEIDKTITTIKETDLRTGEVFAGNSLYQIVEQPTIDLPGVDVALRAVRINPRRGNIETISFCKGEYHYSKTTENYINLFYGKYSVTEK